MHKHNRPKPCPEHQAAAGARWAAVPLGVSVHARCIPILKTLLFA